VLVEGFCVFFELGSEQLRVTNLVALVEYIR